MTSCLLATIAVPCFSITQAVKEDGSPADYDRVSTIADWEKSTNDLQALAARGAISPDIVLEKNVHAASIIGSHTPKTNASLIQTPASHWRRPPGRIRPPRPVSPRLRGIHSVTNLGIVDGKENLQLDGQFSASDLSNGLVFDCGTGLLDDPPYAASIISGTLKQIVIAVSPNLLDRTCTIKPKTDGGRQDFATYSFQFAGLTCKEWQALCPTQTVGVFQTTASDGSKISIDIRNGPRPEDAFTAADVTEIKAALSQIPPDDLKNVHFIQYKQDFQPYIRDSDIGNGGGIYIGDLGFTRYTGWYNFPVGYGVGALLYAHLPEQEAAFWKTHNEVWMPETSFGVHYFDWLKGTWDFIRVGIDAPTETPAAATTDVQQMLVMATHFYDPKTGFMTQGDATGYPLIFKKDRIQLNDVIFNLDGNNIVGETRGGGSETFYQEPIPVPDLFLQRIPQKP